MERSDIWCCRLCPKDCRCGYAGPGGRFGHPGQRRRRISDVVQPGENGFLVPVNDLAAFAQRLTSMLDPEVLAGLKRRSRQLAGNFDLAVSPATGNTPHQSAATS